MIIGDKPVADDAAFLKEAKAIAANRPDMGVFIRADSSVKSATVMHVMDLLKQAGFTKVALTPPPTVK